MSQNQGQGLTMQPSLKKHPYTSLVEKWHDWFQQYWHRHSATECTCCHCQFADKEQEDQCYSHQCRRDEQQLRGNFLCTICDVKSPGPDSIPYCCNLHTRGLIGCNHTECIEKPLYHRHSSQRGIVDGHLVHAIDHNQSKTCHLTCVLFALTNLLYCSALYIFKLLHHSHINVHLA